MKIITLPFLLAALMCCFSLLAMEDCSQPKILVSQEAYSIAQKDCKDFFGIINNDLLFFKNKLATLNPDHSTPTDLDTIKKLVKEKEALTGTFITMVKAHTDVDPMRIYTLITPYLNLFAQHYAEVQKTEKQQESFPKYVHIHYDQRYTQLIEINARATEFKAVMNPHEIFFAEEWWSKILE